ncbi:MAG: hypothetical protein RIT40_494, partial [Planctomycetota bacterium]
MPLRWGAVGEKNTHVLTGGNKWELGCRTGALGGGCGALVG